MVRSTSSITTLPSREIAHLCFFLTLHGPPSCAYASVLARPTAPALWDPIVPQACAAGPAIHRASQPRPALSIATRLCQQQPHWGTHTPPVFVRVSLPSPWPPLLFAASKKSVIPSTIHPTPLDLICAWLPFIAHVVVTPPIHSFVHSFAHFSRFLSFSPSFAFESAAICNFATMMFSFPTNKQRGRKKGKKKMTNNKEDDLVPRTVRA